MLISRQLRIRYRQTVLGVLWALLQPLMLMAMFSLLFMRVPRIGADNAHYTMFLLAGLVPWLFFSRSFGDGSSCLISERSLIQKVYFPRLIVPIVIVLVGIIDLVIPLSLLLLLVLIFSSDTLTANIFYMPLFLILETVFIAGVVLWFSMLCVRFRDVKMLVPTVTMMLMFSSPVFFQLDFVGPRVKDILLLNPLATVIEGVRWSLYDTDFTLNHSVYASIFIAVILFVSGLVYFIRTEDNIDDYY